MMLSKSHILVLRAGVDPETRGMIGDMSWRHF